MASIISVDTLQDSAGSNEITTANVKTAFDQRVKAWMYGRRYTDSFGSQQLRGHRTCTLNYFSMNYEVMAQAEDGKSS